MQQLMARKIYYDKITLIPKRCNCVLGFFLCFSYTKYVEIDLYGSIQFRYQKVYGKLRDSVQAHLGLNVV